MKHILPGKKQILRFLILWTLVLIVSSGQTMIFASAAGGSGYRVTINYYDEETGRRLRQPRVIEGLAAGDTYDIEAAGYAYGILGDYMLMYSDGEYTGMIEDSDVVINMFYLVPGEEVVEDIEIPISDIPLLDEPAKQEAGYPDMPVTGGSAQEWLGLCGIGFVILGMLLDGRKEHRANR